nr:hypothetical protein [Tanacetum cinerariifolium]
MQTQTSNTLHNAIMEAVSKDRPPMLAPGNYVQWKSRTKRYIDTKPNQELIHYYLTSPPYELGWKEKFVLVSEGHPITTTERVFEMYKNVTQDIRDQLNAEAEAVQIILIGIDNDIYSTVDACPNACEMWKAIERLKQVNEIRAEKTAGIANPLTLVAQQQPVYHPQTHPTHYNQNSSTRKLQATNKNRGKAIVNSPQPIYDQEPSMVDDDDETLKDKEIDKLMALISLLLGNVAGAKETVGLTVVQKYGIQCYKCKEYGHVARECQKPKRAKDAAYHREKMLLYAVDSGPIFDTELEQKVQNDDHYDVFAIECQHPEQSESVHKTYLIEQDAQNMIIDLSFVASYRTRARVFAGEGGGGIVGVVECGGVEQKGGRMELQVVVGNKDVNSVFERGGKTVVCL